MAERRHNFGVVSGFLSALAIGLLLHVPVVIYGDSHAALRPHLQPGQKLRYQGRVRLERRLKTQSNVAIMLQPREGEKDVSTVLRLAVNEVRVQSGRLVTWSGRTVFEQGVGDAGGGRNVEPGSNVEFTLSGGGRLTQQNGLDNLELEQRVLWQFWVARFAYGWSLPAQRPLRPGDRWKTEEPETTPSPIAGLTWENDTTYARDDACPVAADERCAIFLTQATLRQKSSPKDATPQDYRLRELRTSGVATGTNETITYLSWKTGLVMRATEDARQAMDVVVAKADGSNHVQYTMEVTSHLEIVLAPE